MNMEHDKTPHPSETQCEDIKKLLILWPQVIGRIERVENTVDIHSNDITELKKSAAETKVYVKMILEKLDGMESRMFNYIKQAMMDSTNERMADRKLDYEERKDGSKERIQNTSTYTNLIKYIIGATIGALIVVVGTFIKK
jgi:hypothetical protein